MLGADIRSALRAVRRSPGFSVLAIVTLALGIGVTTVVFGALNALVLRPLPIANPAEVVQLESNRLLSMSFPDFLDVQRDNRSFSGLALGTFGVLAVVLAIAGVYGGAAYTVSSRTRELGIRQAVGATRAQVLSSVLGRTGTLVAAGSMLGIALGTAIQGALEAVVYEASVRDPLLVGAVVLMMSAVGLVATWIPARQALRLDPAQILRS
jgi:ABC-type antimicrobial peptide transport system permease subunit